jgi:hypothetical protein
VFVTSLFKTTTCSCNSSIVHIMLLVPLSLDGLLQNLEAPMKLLKQMKLAHIGLL